MRRKTLSLFLALTLSLALLPGAALAADQETETQTPGTIESIDDEDTGQAVEATVDEKDGVTEVTSKAADEEEPGIAMLSGNSDDAVLEENAVTEVDKAADEGEDSLAADDSAGDGITYSWTADTLTISGTGPMKDFDIGAGEHAPWYGRTVSSIVIGEGVTHIGDFAFMGSNVSRVILPQSIRTIGEAAFSSCHELTSIELSAGLTSIGESAFLGCSMSSIAIPDSVTEIGAYAFSDCNKLTSVKLSTGLASIGEEAFAYCSQLKSISIPESVTEIGKSAFSHCSALTSVNLPSDLSSIEDTVFWRCTSLDNVMIPSSVTSIEYAAFASCTRLKSIDIPSNVTKIGERAFLNCTSIPDTYIPKTVSSIGDKAFGYKVVQVTDSGEADMPDVPKTRAGVTRNELRLRDDFTIFGYTTTKAESFANDNTIPFVAIQGTTGSGEAREYEFVVVPEASNTTYTLQSGGTVTIYSTGRLEDFLLLRVDGEIVEPSNYTIKDGSTVLTLLSTYLDKLSPGKHPASLEYRNGVANTTITILKKNADSSGDQGSSNAGSQNQGTTTRPGGTSTNPTPSGTSYVTSRTPATGDHSQWTVWMALLTASVFCGGAAFVYYRKTRKQL